jgi:Zn-dependent protease
MLPTKNGSIRLFRWAGIDVFLHWSWFIVALIQIQYFRKSYPSLVWNALEYVGLFVIVLLHEFGHALACRQVGGRAEQIVLWPLGGVAYVAPPQRPGATLWSIAAGPLVNVALAPVLVIGSVLANSFAGPDSNLTTLFVHITVINIVIFCFNMLPIYPLDGGQILRSVLWFFLGRAKSLFVAVIIGFVGVGALVLVAIASWMLHWSGFGPLFPVVAVFMFLNCWSGLMQARVLAKIDKLPRRDGFACPICKQRPILGRFWVCHKCRSRFDTFQTQATCPVCAEQFPVTHCLDCGEAHPLEQWATAPAQPPVLRQH